MSELIPGYYLWRDRIPFIITLLYFTYKAYPDKKIEALMNLFSDGFLVLIPALTISSLIVWFNEESLYRIFGFRWSIASPLSWCIFILAGYFLMRRNGNMSVDSFFYSFICGVGCGWLYDVHWWLQSGNLGLILKVNYYKVFFIDYQIICIVIFLVLVLSVKQYHDNRLSVPLLIFAFAFYYFTPYTKPIFYSINRDIYKYLIRLPVQLYFLNVIREIKPWLCDSIE